MVLFYSHDSGHGFWKLIWLNQFFILFLIEYFLSLSFNIGLIGIEFYNLFYFLWSYPNLMIQVWKVNSSWHKLFFF
jgi:hypothetical protein